MRIHEIENWENKELTRETWESNSRIYRDGDEWIFKSDEINPEFVARHTIDQMVKFADWKEYKRPKTITLYRHTFNFSGKYWQSDWTTIKRDIGHKMIGGEIVVHRESKEVTI